MINRVFEWPIMLYATAERFPITQKILKLTKNATIPHRRINMRVSVFMNLGSSVIGSKNGTKINSSKPERGAW